MSTETTVVSTTAAGTTRPASTRRRERSGNRGKPATRLALALLTWLLTLMFVFPVFWMVLTSFKTEGEAVTLPPKLFFTPTLEHYLNIGDRGISPYLRNSVLAAGLSTLLVIMLALPAAYALAIRPVSKWRDGLFFFLSTRFLPVAGVIAGIFILARNFGLLDSVVVLIIFYISSNLPIAIWMIRSFMLEIPIEILEAARVDGAGLLRTMQAIIAPMLAPGIASTALICLIFSWNEFFLAVNLTSTDNAATLPAFLTGFITSEGAFWAQLDAVATVCAVPVIIAGWVAQKQLVRGLSLGAVK